MTRPRYISLVAVAVILLTAMVAFFLTWSGSGQTRGVPPANSGSQASATLRAVSFRVTGDEGVETWDGARVWVATGEGVVSEARNVGPNQFEANLAAGSYTVLADARGEPDSRLLSAPERLDVAREKGGGTTELVLRKTGHLQVDVVDSRDAPVDGASITLKHPDTIGFSILYTFGRYILGRPFNRLLTSDKTGSASLSLLPLGATVYVSAASASGRSPNVEVTVTERDEVRLVLADLEDAFGATVAGLDGEALTDFQLRYKIVNKHGMVESLGTVMSDAQGKVHVPLNDSDIVRFDPADDGFSLVQAYRYYSIEDNGTTLHAFRPFSFSVRASYPDGSACLGQIDIESGANRLRFLPARHAPQVKSVMPAGSSVHFNLTGTVEAHDFPRASDVNVTVAPDRDGFTWTSLQVDLNAIEPGSTIDVELKVDDRPKRTGVITVELSDELAEPAHVTVVSIKSGYPYYSETITDTLTVRVPFGEFIVTARSGETAWESPIVSVGPDANPTVTVPRRSGGSIRLIVQDSDSKAISGAVFETENLKAPDFPEVAEPGVRSLSDENGALALDWQPAGWRKYRLEAPGCQPKLIDVHVVAAETINLGVVQLEPAKGTLEIVVEGHIPEGLTVKATIHPTYNRARRISRETPLEDGRIKYESLVTGRSYAVILRSYWVRTQADGYDVEEYEATLQIRDVVLPEYTPNQQLKVSLSEFKR